MHVIFKEFKSNNDTDNNNKIQSDFYDKLIQLIIEQITENSNDKKINLFAHLKKTEETENETLNYSFKYPIYALLTHINNNYNNFLFFQTSYLFFFSFFFSFFLCFAFCLSFVFCCVLCI